MISENNLFLCKLFIHKADKISGNTEQGIELILGLNIFFNMASVSKLSLIFIFCKAHRQSAKFRQSIYSLFVLTSTLLYSLNRDYSSYSYSSLSLFYFLFEPSFILSLPYVNFILYLFNYFNSESLNAIIISLFDFPRLARK